MRQVGTSIQKYFRKLRTPTVIAGTASGVLVALLLEVIDETAKNSLSLQFTGFYMMALIALVCLILVAYYLMRIEKLVEDRNYTRFITGKPERLNLMTECIKDAKRSIYILSNLSGAEETQLEEHEKYIDALNRVMEDNRGNPDFEITRIVVPPSSVGKDTEADPDWIYNTPVTQAYREHFRRLREFDQVSPKHNNAPRNVSVILIDNKYLFWKPELTYGDETLGTLLNGGLYLEDYTREGIEDFVECFRIMFERAQFTDLARFDSDSTRS